MIKAEQKGKGVKIEISGDREQNRKELITIFINALSMFSENEIFQMLGAAEGLVDNDDVLTIDNSKPSDDSFS